MAGDGVMCADAESESYRRNGGVESDNKVAQHAQAASSCLRRWQVEVPLAALGHHMAKTAIAVRKAIPS